MLTSVVMGGFFLVNSYSVNIVPIPVPKEINLTNPYTNTKVTEVMCDAAMAAPLTLAFQCLVANNWQKHLKLYNGCYVYRNIAGTNRLSKHAYGRAIDVNAFIPQPPEVVTCFKAAGFRWGGDWKSKYDPMHFEYLRRK